jgi:formylglycine-generating enzyme required for sulfatase activity
LGWVAAVAAQSLAPGQVFRDCADCPEMVVIPAGEVTLGSPADETVRERLPERLAARERIRHRVTFATPFAVGRFEVTKGQYAQFVAATGYSGARGCYVWNFATLDWVNDTDKSWRNPGFAQGDDEPVVCVSWADADVYVSWLSRQTGKAYRLLSEAEWEYAARAGSDTARYWGEGRDQACEYANIFDRATARQLGGEQALADPENFFACDDGHVFTARAGRFRPNAFGLYDMIGNVWEWTADCFHPTYDGAPVDGSARLTGPCDYRTDRGAGWNFKPRIARAAFRGMPDPKRQDTDLGFRLARDLD